MKTYKLICILLAILLSRQVSAQTCDCEAEFTHIKSFMEQNYAGFKDKQALITKAGYEKLANEYLGYARSPHSHEECLMIISQFLSHFKDDHVSIGANFDATKVDSSFVSQRQIIPISDEKIAELRKSKTAEGIYDFKWDSGAYKIAVIKDKTPLHDYIGVIIGSKLPGWKKGMLKIEGKQVNDSLLRGVIYMKNQMPKPEGFFIGRNILGGDWQREGTVGEKRISKYVPVASKKLDDKTLYIKISNFSLGNYKNIDSVFKVNTDALKTMPYLVLDLRGNGGGGDFSYTPILPYIYTDPIHEIGADLYATEANISGYKKNLDDKDMPENERISLEKTIAYMEANKGKWITKSTDNVMSNYKKLPEPIKVVVLIDKGCASTTEQFLLAARQSSKVILMGENTSGTLDYSNWVEAPFSCMPYVLRYSTTRSRRLDVGQGIDNAGIKPDRYLNPNEDWIKAAMDALEK